VVAPIPSTLKKTGQTKSYKASGDEVTDGSIKDDGTYQTGVAHSYTRDATNKTVTDNVTGLIWQDDDATPVLKSWVNAILYCGNLDFAGSTE